MKFWLFIFFCSLLLPIKMIISGTGMKKPDRETALSQKREPAMAVLQKPADRKKNDGTLCQKIGWIMLTVSAGIILLCLNASGTILGIVGIAVIIVQTVLSRVLLLRFNR